MRRASPEAEEVFTKLRSIGVSQPYASQLARGVRQPSVDLTVRAWREAGLKLGTFRGHEPEAIEGFIAVFERTGAAA